MSSHVHNLQATRPAYATLPWARLPTELQLDIFSRLPSRSLAAAHQTCRPWHALAATPSLWRDHVRVEQPAMPQIPTEAQTWKDLFAANCAIRRAWLTGTWEQTPVAPGADPYSTGLLLGDPVSGVYTYQGFTMWPTSSAPAPHQQHFAVPSCTAACLLDPGTIACVTDNHEIQLRNPSQGELLGIQRSRPRKAHAAVAIDATHFAISYDSGVIDLLERDNPTPITTLEGHTSRVNALVLLPNGRLLSAASDHSARLWDLTTGLCEQIYRGHKDYVRAVAPLPNSRLATTSRDTTLAIWNQTTGTMLQQLPIKSNVAYSLCYLPVGILATGDCDGRIKLWDIEEGKCLREVCLSPHPTRVGMHPVREIIALDPQRILALVDGRGPIFIDVKVAPRT